jgi:competence ComEA-like helix-hairpin-helix protein
VNQMEPTLNSESQASQTRSFFAAFLIAAVLACLFAIMSLPGPREKSLALADKINPNIAPLPSLIRLSGIGPARAEAIIGLREAALMEEGEYPFSSPDDLKRVRGIGPKTAYRIEGQVTFEGASQK